MKDPQKQKLKDLIQGSLFLDKETKDSLLENFDALTEGELLNIQNLFEKSEINQNSLIEKIVRHDDTFLPRLKQFKHEEIKKYQHQAEKKERTKEKAEDILKQI